MDGNTFFAAYASYAFTDVAAILSNYAFVPNGRTVNEVSEHKGTRMYLVIR